MAIKFPVSPDENDVHTVSPSRQYIFKGGRWEVFINTTPESQFHPVPVSYDIIGDVSGVIEPAATFLIFNVVRPVTIPANFSGSVATRTGAADQSFNVAIKLNNVDLGAIEYNSNGEVAFTALTETQLVPGDQITIHGPAEVPTGLSRVSFTILGRS